MATKTSSLYASISSTTLAALLCFGMSGCVSDKQSRENSASGEKMPLREMLAQKKLFANDPELAQGVEKLLEGDYDAANYHFNVALEQKPSNNVAHYLNALSYHLQANDGDSGQYDMASAGYEQALKYNPNNAMAALQLGRVKAAQKDYVSAQEHFAQVLLVEPKNKDALYELANASYLAGDVKHASAAIDQYLRKNKDAPEAYRAAAIIYAAMGQSERSLEFFNHYKENA
ncbi:MAG: tetratricopeptide repeat protein, partial [Alphaproteobacteria bacterium]|nr:tetratricopeptide repeat protein [Alphaproteobacteria bacterium]